MGITKLWELDVELADALRRGEELAFRALLRRYHASLMRLVRLYVRCHGLAEEIVQEVWIAVLRGIHRFEGRSSLKSWIFGIAVNVAKERVLREKRSIPLSALVPAGEDDDGAIDPARFRGASDAYPGGWTTQGMPPTWDANQEARLFSREMRLLILDAITELPEQQRMVITLRDVDGMSAIEVEGVLGLSEANQRVLLHRARLRIRNRVAKHLGTE